MSTAGPPSAVSRANVSIAARQARLERRLEHQILRRVAGDEQLGKGDDVGVILSR